MFDKILIANRGEIACRIIKTAKQMAIKTVAVYSEADKNALHVNMADESYHIGPAPSSESYLKYETIIEVAKRCQAQAIHPGYGFLSENEKFAQLCADNGIVFIGPPPSAIAAMGSKSTAKKIMQEANVPILPGYHGDQQSHDALLAEAKKIGYPVLLKAAAGGGGKGMRIVHGDDEFTSALEGAKREAKAAFGDDHMLVEKYLESSRHIEVQVFADSHGQAVHLFERDCSIQRRHQKVVEEAPAVGLSTQLREQLGQAAILAAKAINYQGAGTVEFLLANDNSFYFLEMNTRLQVEHPVTEYITGQDLVAWQFMVAYGDELPNLSPTMSGHAIEVRIYAEDTEHNFLPSIGNISYLHTPEATKNVRIDTGIIQGDDISMYYDPMIAKLIVYGQNRETAIAQLQSALKEFHVVGVKTNIDYLATIINHPAYISAKLSTNFIDNYHKELIPKASLQTHEILALASLYILLEQQAIQSEFAKKSDDPYSPWNQLDGWLMNQNNSQQLHLINKNETSQIIINTMHDNHHRLLIDEQEYLVKGHITNKELNATINGKKIQTTIIKSDNEINILGIDIHHRISLKNLTLAADSTSDSDNQLTSRMPGTVVALPAKVSESVTKGSPLIVMEAMKMEHTIYAPCDGTITAIHYKVGDLVDEGKELVSFEASKATCA